MKKQRCSILLKSLFWRNWEGLVAEEEEEESKTNMKSKTRLRVLVVEDEDEIKAYLKSELSDEYKVETCSNGKEAYDLILRDTLI